jgi:hypothetical protein
MILTLSRTFVSCTPVKWHRRVWKYDDAKKTHNDIKKEVMDELSKIISTYAEKMLSLSQQPVNVSTRTSEAVKK